MITVLKCIGVVIFFIFVFILMGMAVSKVIRRISTLTESLALGFFCYYAVFQIVALPLILLKQKLSLLCILWLIVIFFVLIAGAAIVIKSKMKYTSYVSIKKKSKVSIGCYAVLAGIMVFFCYLICVQDYWEWDTAYYIGTISTAVKTDTMYQINGEDGMPETVLAFRYALSAFYMNSAVFCKITGIEPVYFQKYAIGMLCVIMYFVVVYLIGKVIFYNDMQKATVFCIVIGIVNLVFGTEYTTSQFLILRAYEAKAFCANVVMPTIFWLLMLIYHDMENKGNWRALFIVMFASVPVSMSSILLAPALVGVVFLAEIIVDKKWKYIRPTLICMLPNVVYLVIYLLYTLNLFTIKV